MGLILVIVFAVVGLFVLLGKFLLKDLRAYFWDTLNGQFRLFNKKGNNLGQLFSTIMVAVFIGVLSFLLFKTILVLVSYLITGNLIEFFVVNRGVFSSYGTDLQNPYLAKNLLYGVLITPLAQLFSIYFMIKSLQYFMLNINNYFNQKMYKVSSLVFFGAFSCLVFLVLELLVYAQSVTLVSTLSLVILLIGAKLPYLLFYFGIIHIELSENKSYFDALKDFHFNKLEAKLITKPFWMITVVLIIAIVLNFPLYTGFQFGSNNWIILLKLIVAGGVFSFILKKVFAKGFNYIGVYMLDDNKNQDILSIKFINKKSKIIILYCLIGLTVILLMISFKSFVFFVFNALGFAFIASILLFIIYCIGTLYSKFRKDTDYGLSLNWLIISKTFTSFMILIIPAMLFMVFVFNILTAFPKEIKDIENYSNYQKSIVDEQGNLLYFKTDDLNPSLPIQFEKLPPFFVKALLIKEDRNALNQKNLLPNRSNWHGVSLTTLYSLMLKGSSNINQQLLKNLIFLNKKGEKLFPQEIQRKFSQIGVSYQLSNTHTPEEIITHYVNIVSFNGGYGQSGITNGSYYTFGRSINNVNELEILYLLFTLHRGSTFKISDDNYIPYKEAHLYPKEIKEKLLRYTKRWYENGRITKKEFKKLKRQQLNFTNKPFSLNNSAATNIFFDDNIKKEANENVTLESSISLKTQSKLNLAVDRFNTKFSNQMVKDGCKLYASALIVDVKSGNILGHYGGEGKHDLSTFGEGISMSSEIKPFVLLELLEKGHQIRLYDGKIRGRKTPKNANHGYSNKFVNLSEILKKSHNAPMRNIDQLTAPIPLFLSVEEKFHKMNISVDSAINLNDKQKKLEHTLNYPLGSRRMTIYDIAQSYQTLFNEGQYIKLSVFNKSFNPYHLKEQTIRKDKAQIYNKQNVSIITNALKTVLEKGGTAHSLNKYLPKNVQFMSKTGTADKYKHGFTILCDGNTLVVSWVSYGKEVGGKLKLGQTEIPNKSGGSSAGVFAALIFDELYK